MATNDTPSDSDTEPPRSPIDDAAVDLDLGIDLEASVAPTYAAADDIDTHVEVPFRPPADTWRLVAVLTDRATGRVVRRIVDYNPVAETVTETERGIAGDPDRRVGERENVFAHRIGGLEYRPDGQVHIVPLDETVSVETYLDEYAFDEAGWRLGAGFDAAIDAAEWP